MLRLDLLARCLAVHCGAGESCVDGDCRSDEVGASELELWPGKVDRQELWTATSRVGRVCGRRMHLPL